MNRQKLAKLRSTIRKTKAPGLRRGRFSQRTRELAYELIRDGLTEQALVDVVGVSASTANRWCKEAKDYREVKVQAAVAGPAEVNRFVISLRLKNGMTIECADPESLAQVLERLNAVS